jgi:hypothetical protein
VCASGIAAALALLVSAPAAAQISDPSSELRFTAEGPDRAQIMLRERLTVYDPVDDRTHIRVKDLCRAPCWPKLSPGAHELTMQKGYDNSFPTRPVVIPNGPATLHGTITSRKRLRIGLLVGGVVSWATGHVMLLTGLLGGGSHGPIIVGIGIPTLALGVGTFAASLFIRDGLRFDVLPGVQPTPVVGLPAVGPTDRRSLAVGDPGGLTLRVRF